MSQIQAAICFTCIAVCVVYFVVIGIAGAAAAGGALGVIGIVLGSIAVGAGLFAAGVVEREDS